MKILEKICNIIKQVFMPEKAVCKCGCDEFGYTTSHVVDGYTIGFQCHCKKCGEIMYMFFDGRFEW